MAATLEIITTSGLGTQTANVVAAGSSTPANVTLTEAGTSGRYRGSATTAASTYYTWTCTDSNGNVHRGDFWTDADNNETAGPVTLAPPVVQQLSRLDRPYRAVYYVREDGNDSNDGLTPATAKLTADGVAAVVTSFDVIKFGPGTFAIPSGGLTLPDNVTVEGCGRDKTYLDDSSLYNGLSISSGANGITLRDLSMLYTAGNFNALDYTPGVIAGGADHTIERCDITGAADVLVGVGGRIIVRDSRLRSQVDTILCTGSVTELEFVDSSIVVVSTLHADVNGIDLGVSGSVGIIRNSSIYTIDPNATEQASALIVASGATCIVQDSTLSGQLLDIENYGTVVVNNVSYDPAKVAGGGTLVRHTGTPPTPEQIADVVDVAGALEAYDVAKASELPDEPDNSGIAAIKERTDRLPDVPAAKGDIINPAGDGARTVTITVTDGSDPVPGARVRLSKGAETAIATADETGVAVLNVDDGTWAVAITAPYYTFAGASLTVDGDESQAYAMTLVVIPPAPGPEQSAGYLFTFNGNGDAQAGVVIEFRCKAANGASATSYPRGIFAGTSNSEGLLQVNLVRGFTYEARRVSTVTDNKGPWVPFTVADADTYALPQVLGEYTDVAD